MTYGHKESRWERSNREVAYASVAALAGRFGKRARRADRKHSVSPDAATSAEAETWEKARKETQALANRLLRSL